MGRYLATLSCGGLELGARKGGRRCCSNEQSRSYPDGERPSRPFKNTHKCLTQGSLLRRRSSLSASRRLRRIWANCECCGGAAGPGDPRCLCQGVSTNQSRRCAAQGSTTRLYSGTTTLAVFSARSRRTMRAMRVIQRLRLRGCLGRTPLCRLRARGAREIFRRSTTTKTTAPRASEARKTGASQASGRGALVLRAGLEAERGGHLLLPPPPPPPPPPPRDRTSASVDGRLLSFCSSTSKASSRASLHRSVTTSSPWRASSASCAGKAARWVLLCLCCVFRLNSPLLPSFLPSLLFPLSPPMTNPSFFPPSLPFSLPHSLPNSLTTSLAPSLPFSFPISLYPSLPPARPPQGSSIASLYKAIGCSIPQTKEYLNTLMKLREVHAKKNRTYGVMYVAAEQA